MRLLGVDKIITPEVAPNLDGVRKPLIVLLARQPRPQWPIGIHALLAHGQATAALTKKAPFFSQGLILLFWGRYFMRSWVLCWGLHVA